MDDGFLCGFVVCSSPAQVGGPERGLWLHCVPGLSLI